MFFALPERKGQMISLRFPAAVVFFGHCFCHCHWRCGSGGGWKFPPKGCKFLSGWHCGVKNTLLYVLCTLERRCSAAVAGNSRAWRGRSTSQLHTDSSVKIRPWRGHSRGMIRAATPRRAGVSAYLLKDVPGAPLWLFKPRPFCVFWGPGWLW